MFAPIRIPWLKKNIVKIQNFEKIKRKLSGYRLDSYISSKFSINLLDVVIEKAFTDDGRPRH